MAAASRRQTEYEEGDGEHGTPRGRPRVTDSR